MSETRILSDGLKIYNKKDGSNNIYDLIPPSPTSGHRGGIIADAKTDEYIIEVKVGEDGKCYTPIDTQLSAQGSNPIMNKTVTEAFSELENKIPNTLADLNSDATHRTVTDVEKDTWNNKAGMSDIPTSLPANGGNADTVNGITIMPPMSQSEYDALTTKDSNTLYLIV